MVHINTDPYSESSSVHSWASSRSTRISKQSNMKYCIALFAAIIAVGLVDASYVAATAPAPSIINSLLAAIKQYIEIILSSLVTAVNYILNVLVSKLMNLILLVGKPNTPVPVAPLLQALLALKVKNVASILTGLGAMLGVNLSLILYLVPTPVANLVLNVVALGQELQALGQASVPLGLLVQKLSAAVYGCIALRI